jgi:hypothetical protein
VFSRRSHPWKGPPLVPTQSTIILKHTRAQSWTGSKNANAALGSHTVAVERPDEGTATVDVPCPECGEVLPVKVESAAAIDAAAANARKAGKTLLVSAAVDIAVGAGLLWFDMVEFAVIAFAAGLFSGVYGLLRLRNTAKGTGVALQGFPWTGEGDSPFGVYPAHQVLPRPAAFSGNEVR